MTEYLYSASYRGKDKAQQAYARLKSHYRHEGTPVKEHANHVGKCIQLTEPGKTTLDMIIERNSALKYKSIDMITK